MLYGFYILMKKNDNMIEIFDIPLAQTNCTMGLHNP